MDPVSGLLLLCLLPYLVLCANETSTGFQHISHLKPRYPKPQQALIDQFDAIFYMKKDKSGGSCAKYADKIYTSYGETCQSLAAALNAITAISHGRPPSGDSDADNEYFRQAQMFQAMFGDDVMNPDGTLTLNGQDVQSKHRFIASALWPWTESRMTTSSSVYCCPTGCL